MSPLSDDNLLEKRFPVIHSNLRANRNFIFSAADLLAAAPLLRTAKKLSCDAIEDLYEVLNEKLVSDEGYFQTAEYFLGNRDLIRSQVLPQRYRRVGIDLSAGFPDRMKQGRAQEDFVFSTPFKTVLVGDDLFSRVTDVRFRDSDSQERYRDDFRKAATKFLKMAIINQAADAVMPVQFLDVSGVNNQRALQCLKETGRPIILSVLADGQPIPELPMHLQFAQSVKIFSSCGSEIAVRGINGEWHIEDSSAFKEFANVNGMNARGIARDLSTQHDPDVAFPSVDR